MLSWELEDWITDVGANVLDKRIANPASLSPKEALVYEIWLLDTEARNGGLSQYFCNHGIEQWQCCEAVAKQADLASFVPFAAALNSIVGGSSDPYSAVQEKGDAAEDLWFKHQSSVVNELRALYENAL